jgi:tRNA (cmo5U34)-methyltransferase
MSFIGEISGMDFRMTAIDSSEPMVERYRNRIREAGMSEKIDLVCSDIRDIDIRNSSVAVMNLTLQFLPVQDRDSFIRKVYEGLNDGGLFLITEKIHHKDGFLDQLEQNFYYRFKKENGYSELEISQKREALENVLVPETIEQHLERFEKCGFSRTAIWHKWFNFCSFLCIK